MLIQRTMVFVFALYLALIPDSAQSQRRSQQMRIKNPPTAIPQQKSADEQKGTEQSPFIIKTIPTPKTEEERDQEAKERERVADSDRKKEKSDADMVKYTGELAFFTKGLFTATVLLFIATIGLLVAGWRQLKLARDEFISTHRPKLIVRQFVLNRPVPNQIVTVDFSIINVGNTKAIWRYYASEVALWNGQFWEAPGINHIVQPISLPPIKNGQRVQTRSVSRFMITGQQIKSAEEGRLYISVIGELTYADSLGTNRRTGFRRNYDYLTDTFVASPNGCGQLLMYG